LRPNIEIERSTSTTLLVRSHPPMRLKRKRFRSVGVLESDPEEAGGDRLQGANPGQLRSTSEALPKKPSARNRRLAGAASHGLRVDFLGLGAGDTC